MAQAALVGLYNSKYSAGGLFTHTTGGQLIAYIYHRPAFAAHSLDGRDTGRLVLVLPSVGPLRARS